MTLERFLLGIARYAVERPENLNLEVNIRVDESDHIHVERKDGKVYVTSESFPCSMLTPELN